MRSKALGVLGLLLMAAVAAPLVTATAGAKTRIDPALCSTTETSWRTSEVLDNGTRRRETHDEVEVDCPGRADDTVFVDEKVRWNEDYDGPVCETESRVVKERETLSNGTRRETVTRDDSRDCKGTSKDFSTSSTEVRYLSDDAKGSWLRKAREKMDDGDDPKKERQANEKGLREALKHVPPHVLDRIRALLAQWSH